jgi:hypothetical protein
LNDRFILFTDSTIFQLERHSANLRLPF